MKKALEVFLATITGSVLVYGALFATAASLTTTHTSFPTPDATANWGTFAAIENLVTAVQTNMLSKTVVNNNATTPYQIPSSTAYVMFTGTLPQTFTASMPSAANSLDGQEVTLFAQSGVTTALTVASSGATVVGTPATLAANGTLKYKYDADTTSWIVVGH